MSSSTALKKSAPAMKKFGDDEITKEIPTPTKVKQILLEDSLEASIVKNTAPTTSVKLVPNNISTPKADVKFDSSEILDFIEERSKHTEEQIGKISNGLSGLVVQAEENKKILPVISDNFTEINKKFAELETIKTELKEDNKDRANKLQDEFLKMVKFISGELSKISSQVNTANEKTASNAYDLSEQLKDIKNIKDTVVEVCNEIKNDDIKELEKKKTQVKVEIYKLDAEVLEFKAKTEIEKEYFVRANKECQTIIHELKDLNVKKEEAHSLWLKYSNENEHYSTKISNAKEEVSKLDEKIEELSICFKALSDSVEKFSAENKILTKENQDLSFEYSKLKMLVDPLKSDLELLQRREFELKEKNELLHGKSLELSQLINDCELKQNHFKQEISILEREYELKKQELELEHRLGKEKNISELKAQISETERGLSTFLKHNQSRLAEAISDVIYVKGQYSINKTEEAPKFEILKEEIKSVIDIYFKQVLDPNFKEKYGTKMLFLWAMSSTILAATSMIFYFFK